MTGVDRTGLALATAIQKSLLQAEGEAGRMKLALPSSPLVDETMRPPLILSLPRLEASHLQGHIWEQLTLAGLRREDWLLNFCNTGPILRRKQVSMVHDAQVFTQPESYTPAFRTFYRFLLPKLARRSKILLTVSHFSKNELEALGIFPNDKAIVVHNGADHMDDIAPATDALERFGLTEGGFFLAVGSIAPHKNLSMIASVAAARTDQSHPLVIAGGGNQQALCAAGVREGQGVKVLGRVDDHELRSLLDGAISLLFPSLTEGFGLPPLEAMRCGCPVIATTEGAVPEICGSAPMYADPRCPDQWTAAMAELSRSNTTRRSMAAEGLARASDFTWKRAAETVLETIADAERRAA